MTSPFAETLVHDEGLDPSLPALERAVRAVVLRGGEVLMLGAASGAWKFPGGGVEPDESDAAVLHREIGEECGLEVASVDRYLGEVVEWSVARPDDPFPVFVQVSRYYRCTLSAGSGELAFRTASVRWDSPRPGWVWPTRSGRIAHASTARTASYGVS